MTRCGNLSLHRTKELVDFVVVWQCGQSDACVCVCGAGVCLHADLPSVLSEWHDVTLDRNILVSSQLAVNLAKLGPVKTTGCAGEVYTKQQLQDQTAELHPVHTSYPHLRCV